MVKTCPSPGACIWVIRKRNYAGLPIILFWKKAGVERIQGGGSLRKSSGGGGGGGRGPEGDKRYSEPEAASSGQFCEKPSKLYFKTEVGGKCSHLCLSAKSKLPSAAEDNCVNSTRLCICQMVISKEASHLCRDLTLCSVFSQLRFSGSLWQTRREAGRCCHFKGGNTGARRVGGLYDIAELVSSGVRIHTWSSHCTRPLSSHQVCLQGCLGREPGLHGELREEAGLGVG